MNLELNKLEKDILVSGLDSLIQSTNNKIKLLKDEVLINRYNDMLDECIKLKEKLEE